MKNFTLFFVSFWIGLSAYADCDSFLQLPQEDARKAGLYKRDCDIQDRYQKLQTYFSSEGINVAELAEYRLLRFVDRNSYETAKKTEMPPSQIYKPAPTTWEVWDSGIRALFADDTQVAALLFRSGGFNSSEKGYENLNFTLINGALLKNENGDISRDYLSGIRRRESKPGTYRQAGDAQVGWTAAIPDCKDKVTCAQNSMFKAQQNWEVEYGMNFNEVVREWNGQKPNAATLAVPMTVTPADAGKFYVAYAPSDLVPAQISWLDIFVKATITRYRANKPLMPPIEFSALVQKWLVTIHPFSDGNGRTSRAVQDFILATFKMPYAPGGDLQNDTLEDFDKYVDLTYDRMENMVLKLEACAEEYRQKQKPSYGCRTVKSMETITN